MCFPVLYHSNSVKKHLETPPELQDRAQNTKSPHRGGTF